MSDLAIQSQNLGKRYRIGVARRTSGRPRSILQAISPFRYLASTLRAPAPDEVVWALKDATFDVKHGEVLGLIGHNGAGKSTLLKILSRITEPTSGRAVLNGRVGSLLEVGTGFHPELTGRENVYLSGSILGMRKSEIQRKFDEIVAFAGVEKFIDTPIKRYSSGMKVRLAFAVAAHLEPEILLVDEVLAVGDAAFQKKCLGKMGDVAKTGRTIVFVSHNMVAMQSLCHRAIWLDHGQTCMEGEVSSVISAYLHANSASATEQIWKNIEIAPGNDKVRLHHVTVRPHLGTPSDSITMDTACEIEVKFWNQVPDERLHVTLHLLTDQQVVAFSTGPGASYAPEWGGALLPKGLFRSVCHIPSNLLNSGLYHVNVLIIKDGSRIVYRHDNAVSFEVLDTSRRETIWFGREPGAIHPVLRWTTEHLESL